MFKRILSLVLSLVMVLAGVPMAFADEAAAIPADVVGTEYEEAVTRLALLEILEGYPDGTFKPENQITRAEFAAVALRTKGLESAAQAAKGLPTGFTDVPANHWASGYVGTAAKAGIVNGIGNGKFAPEAPVKYEEAVTMLVRALGYEVAAQSKGGYPYGYLIVANEIGLLDAVKGTQGLPATRGAVAQMADNALEIPMMVQVGYGTETKWVVSGSKEHGGDAKYLLDEMGFDTVEGRVVKVNTKRNEIVVAVEENNKTVNKTLEVGEGFDFYEVEGLKIKAWTDDDAVIVYTIKDEAKFDAVEVDDDELYLVTEDENYEVAKGAYLELNGEEVKQNKFNADYAKIVLNDDDEIVWAEGYKFGGFIVAEEVEDDIVYSFDEYDELKLKDFLVVKDGKTISLDDIEAEDILFYNTAEKFAVVYNNGTEGKVDRVYTDNSFRLDDVAYSLTKLSTPAVYLDEGKIGELDTDILDGFLDDEVTVEVFVDFAGNAVLVKGEVSSIGSSAYVALTDDVHDYDGRKGRMLALDVRNGADEKVSYDLLIADLGSDIELRNIKVNELTTLKKADNVVLKISTNKDGDITAIEKPESVELKEDFDIDDSNAKGIDTYSYRLQSNTIVFHNSNKKATTLGNAEDEFSKVKAGAMLYIEKGRVVAVIGDTDADTDTITVTGLVTKIKELTSGKLQFTIEVYGETERYLTESTSLSEDEFRTKYEDKIVRLTIGEKSKEIKDTLTDGIKVLTGKTLTVSKISGRTITPTNGKAVELNKNAVIYNDEFETLNISDIKKDDVITVYFQGSSNRFVDYVIVDAIDDGTGETGVVTYIVTGYNDTFGRFTLEDRAGEKVTMFVEDFDGFELGGVEVREEVMTAWLNTATIGEDLKTIDVTEDNVLVVEADLEESVELEDGTVAVFTQKQLETALDDDAVIELYGEFGGFEVTSKNVTIKGDAVVDGGILAKADQITIEGLEVKYIEIYNGASDIVIKDNVITGKIGSVGIGNSTGPAMVGKVTIQGNTLEVGAIGLYPTKTLDNYVIVDNTVVTAPDEAVWLCYTADYPGLFDEAKAIEFAKELVLNNDLSSEGDSLVKIEDVATSTIVTEEGVKEGVQ